MSFFKKDEPVRPKDAFEELPVFYQSQKTIQDALKTIRIAYKSGQLRYHSGHRIEGGIYFGPGSTYERSVNHNGPSYFKTWCFVEELNVIGSDAIAREEKEKAEKRIETLKKQTQEAVEEIEKISKRLGKRF